MLETFPACGCSRWRRPLDVQLFSVHFPLATLPFACCTQKFESTTEENSPKKWKNVEKARSPKLKLARKRSSSATFGHSPDAMGASKPANQKPETRDPRTSDQRPEPGLARWSWELQDIGLATVLSRPSTYWGNGKPSLPIKELRGANGKFGSKK